MRYSTSQCLIFSLVCSVYATDMLKPNNAILKKRQEMNPMGEEMGMPMSPMAADVKSEDAGNVAAGAMALATGEIAATSNATARASVASASEPEVTPVISTAAGTAPEGTGAIATSKGNATEKVSAASVPGVAGATGVDAGTRTQAAIVRTTISGVKNTYYTAPANTPTPEAEAAPAVNGSALTTPNIIKAQASAGLDNSTSGLNSSTSGLNSSTSGLNSSTSGLNSSTSGSSSTSDSKPNHAEHGSTTGNLMFSAVVTLALAMYLL